MFQILEITAFLSSNSVLVLQIVILLIHLVGVKFARERTKNSLKKHKQIMTVAVVLNGVTILFFMWPSFNSYLSAGALQVENSLVGFL